LYSILGVDKSSSPKDIQKAFHKKAMEMHPDRGNSNDSFQSSMNSPSFFEISHAYDVLKDEKSRKIYDMLGLDLLGMQEQANWVQMQQRMYTDKQQQQDPDTLFKNHTFSFLPSRKKKEPLIRNFEITVEDVYFRRTKKVRFPRKTFHKDSRVTVTDTLLTFTMNSSCSDGTLVKFEGQGDIDETTGELPGDIIFRLKMKPHPKFSIEKLNLVMYHYLTYQQASVSGVKVKVSVETIDKRMLAIDVLGPIFNDHVEMVPNEGILANDGSRGCLVIIFKVIN